MKKISFYMTALLAMGLVACNEDFAWDASPLSTVEESTYPMDAVTVTPTATTINLADYISEDGATPVSIGTIALKTPLPANTVLRAEVEMSKDADFADAVKMDAIAIGDDNVINLDPNVMEDAYFNQITRNPAQTDLFIRTVLYTVTGGDAEAVIGKPGENYFATSTVKFTPLNKVEIASAYYVIGAAGGWSADGARTQKFQHSGADVYEDPVFTIVIDAGGDDCWFAIGDDKAIDAVAAGDWNQLFGTKGESEDLTGTMDRRTNLGGEHSFHVTGAKKIRITLDMLEYSYTIEPVNIADAYYLIGGPGEWNAQSAMTMEFSHSAKDVFEDPVFTYTFEGNGGTGDMWFAFGDKDAIDAIANNNDWNNLFGTKGESTDLSGSFDRRSALGGEHSFCVDGKAKFYRFSINMADKTYTITPLNFSEYIWEAGVNNGWGGYEQPLYCPDGNGTYTGFFYAQEDSWTDGKGAFKFTGAYNNWDNGNYGTGSLNADGLTGTLIDAGNSGNIMPEPGFYRADVNLATMTFTLTPIKTVFVVGSAVNNDWNTGVEMTFNKEEHCWECDATFTEAGVIKFKGNGTWDNIDGNWGGTMDNIINGSNDNIPVSVSGDVHIKFFARCDNKSYCEITKK